ncbi:MAG: T9SS type B sorting domain-containing protein, partial [Bacteroidota bacterium]
LQLKVNENFNVFIPNVFTPNSNFRNDYFYPICTGVRAIESMKIYNRWGEMLHNSPEKWDGTYMRDPVPEGVYIYEISVRDKRGKKHFYKGTVHVMP